MSRVCELLFRLNSSWISFHSYLDDAAKWRQILIDRIVWKMQLVNNRLHIYQFLSSNSKLVYKFAKILVLVTVNKHFSENQFLLPADGIVILL